MLHSPPDYCLPVLGIKVFYFYFSGVLLKCKYQGLLGAEKAKSKSRLAYPEVVPFFSLGMSEEKSHISPWWPARFNATSAAGILATETFANKCQQKLWNQSSFHANLISQSLERDTLSFLNGKYIHLEQHLNILNFRTEVMIQEWQEPIALCKTAWLY